MKRILSNNRGEGHIDTGVKIIIAVVIGALLIGGLYALFSGVILPKLNTKVQEIMHYEESAVSYRYDAFEMNVSSLQYSYDGTTWENAAVPMFSENAVIKKTLNTTEKDFILALVNDNNSIYIIMTEDNGKTWSITYRLGYFNFRNDRVEYSISQYGSVYYAMVRTYDGRTSTSGWGNEYKSNNGRNWYRDNLGIDFF